MTCEVIDNFFPEEVFETYQILASSNVPLFFSDSVADPSDKDGYYFTHMFYQNYKITSDLFEPLILPILDRINAKALIRAKANFFPRTDTIREHKPHIDYDTEHKVFLLYLNTCDGFTRLAEETVVESVANRAIIFDGDIVHNSTTCTDQKMRRSLNINFL